MLEEGRKRFKIIKKSPAARVLPIDRVVKEIKSDENIEIDLITKSDDICKCCPNTDEEKICVSKEKINELDFNVLKVLNIKEGTYKYRELNDMLMKLLTLKEFNKICEKCSWYSYGYCEEGIFKNKI